MSFRLLRAALAATLALGLIGCAPAITSPHPDDIDQTSTTKIKTTYDAASKTYTSSVDATSDKTFVYFDLDTQKEVMPEDPATDQSWDLAFQSTTVLSNSGVSGQGNVRVARLNGKAFDAVTAAPLSGYKTDAEDGDDSNTIVDSAFLIDGAWYSYNMGTHKVTPHEKVVYVIQSTEGKFFKIAFTGYYDAAGTARFPTFTWAELPAPISTLNFAGGANPASDSWTYLNLRTGAIVTPDSPESSTDWDLAMRAYHVMTNSAVSGGGQGGAMATEAKTLLDLSEVPAGTFSEDTPESVRGTTMPGNKALMTWYGYNPTTHALTSKNVVYALKLAKGDYAKFTFLDYVDGKYGLSWALAAPGKTTF